MFGKVECHQQYTMRKKMYACSNDHLIMYTLRNAKESDTIYKQ